MTPLPSPRLAEGSPRRAPNGGGGKQQILVWMVIGWYLLLVTIHFFNQRPLWLDEACVFGSIKNFYPTQLFTQPLEVGQAFPRLYLWCIQALAKPFHLHLLALRFLPFISMVLAFLVWMDIASRYLRDRRDMLTFALCWAASMPLIYYAAELKQYSMDVLAGSVFIWVMLRWAAGQLNSWIVAALPLFGLFSYTAFFLILLPLYQLLRLCREPRYRVVLCAYVVVCAAVTACFYYFDLRVSNAGMLKACWHEYFISFNSLGDFFKSLGEGINNSISRWFVDFPRPLRGVGRVCVGFGFGYLLWTFYTRLKAAHYQLNSVLTMCAFIFVELLLLGALHQYPFTVPRMSLFFAPALLFVTVEAFAALRVKLPRVYWPLQIVFWGYLVLVSLGIARVIFAGDLGAQSVIWAFTG